MLPNFQNTIIVQQQGVQDLNGKLLIEDLQKMATFFLVCYKQGQCSSEVRFIVIDLV